MRVFFCYTTAMDQLQIFKDNSKIPPLINQQIVDFLRMEWPDGFQGKNRLRNWAVNPKYNPIVFTLIEQDILISHVAVVWKHIEHAGETYKVYALSGMFTYPQFRNQKYGMKLLQAAKEYMLSQDGDLIMIHSKLQGFYEKAGFEPLPYVVTLVGDPNNPTKSDEKVFMLCITEKGKKGKVSFESTPFYFGEDLW